jgi:integrase
MARTVPPLTAKKIEHAKPGEKLRDGGGLILMVSSITGKKSWHFEYNRPGTGKRTSIKLGKYPDIKLGQARAMREKHRELVANGIDPKELRDEQKKEAEREAGRKWGTVKHLAEEWLTEKCNPIERRIANLKRSGAPFNEKETRAKAQRGEIKLDKEPAEKTKKRYREIIDKIIKEFGDTPIEDITVDRVKAFIGGYGTKNADHARRSYSHMDEIWKRAVSYGYAPHNIIADIELDLIAPTPVYKENRAILEPEELQSFIYAINYLSESEEVTIKSLMFYLYTGTRIKNVRFARWQDIDFEKAVWHIDSEFEEGNMKSKRDFDVPLSPQAMKILEEMKAYTDGKTYIFSLNDHNSVISENTHNNAIKRLGYGDKTTAHGLRSTLGTIATKVGKFNSLAVNRVLDHIQPGSDRTMRTYIRSSEYEEERVKIMHWWGQYLEELLREAEEKARKEETAPEADPRQSNATDPQQDQGTPTPKAG